MWYSCGPTVYDASHMGHARCGLIFKFFSYKSQTAGDKFLLRSMPSKHVFVKVSLLLFESEFFVYCGLLP